MAKASSWVRLASGKEDMVQPKSLRRFIDGFQIFRPAGPNDHFNGACISNHGKS
jgi:hypothetical protein